MKKLLAITLLTGILTGGNIAGTQTEVFANVTAKTTSSTVLVNGVDTGFEAYNINDNNYFKIRDIAAAVSGTPKEFDVTWNNDKKAIDLVSNSPYTEIGGELTLGDGQDRVATDNTAIIYKDGVEITLTAYNIEGSTYFKLRDVCEEFEIEVDWDGENNAIIVNSMINGERPVIDGEMPEGERPMIDGEMPEGERPMIDGEMPEGERPMIDGEMPEGERPMIDGEMPEGERPMIDGEMPEGERPMPEGEMPSIATNSLG